MYAIIETGGKQYRVEQGSKIKVESLPVEKGADLTLEKVLLLATDTGIQVGKPTVAGTFSSRNTGQAWRYTFS